MCEGSLAFKRCASAPFEKKPRGKGGTRNTRIIRNEKELLRIREYIEDNPVRWEHEKNNHYCGGWFQATPGHLWILKKFTIDVVEKFTNKLVGLQIFVRYDGYNDDA